MKKLWISWREKGEIEFRKGDIRESEESFAKSEKVFEELLERYEEEKSSQKK